MEAPNPTLELAVVFETSDAVALSVAEAALEEAEIEFSVVEEALTGFGFSPMVNPVCRIQVAQSCAAQAVELLKGSLGPVEEEPSV